MLWLIEKVHNAQTQRGTALRSYELIEHAAKAHAQQQRNIGLTTSVAAVLLAFATMLANDANTKKS